jgi:hypothetical protein
MKKLLLILLCLPMIGFGQGCEYGSGTNVDEICNLLQGNSFSSDRNADKALDKILSVTGLSKNFVLQQCNGINNCVATSYKGIRYILYDKGFMSQIANSSSSWPNLSILAHEIGHHVNGHSLDLVVYASEAANPPTLAQSRQMELEADEYSGFVMFKLGASLSQAQEAVRLISTNKDDSYSTHPKLNKRLAAIKKGYNNAKRQGSTSSASTQKPSGNAESYYDVAKYHSNPEYQLEMLWLAVKADPEYWVAWELRGDIFVEEASTIGKNRGGDCQSYKSALINYNKAIRSNPNRAELYSKRADVLELILDHSLRCLNNAAHDNTPLDKHQRNLYKNYQNQLADRIESINKGIFNKVKAYKVCASLSFLLARNKGKNDSGPVWVEDDVLNYHKKLIQLEPANAWWQYRLITMYEIFNEEKYASQIKMHKSKLKTMINKCNQKQLLDMAFNFSAYSWKSFWPVNSDYNEFIAVFLFNEEAQLEIKWEFVGIGYDKTMSYFRNTAGIQSKMKLEDNTLVGSKVLYDYLYKFEDYTKSYSDFVQQFESIDKQKKVYNLVFDFGYYTKSFEEFRRQFFL